MLPYTVTINEDYSWPRELEETPLKIHPSMIDKMAPEYVEFFNRELTDRPDILETHKFPVAKTKAWGNKIPGQGPLKELAKIYDVEIPRTHTEGPPIPARVYVPKGVAPADGWPCMIWYHGGGWVFGDIGSQGGLCSEIADTVKCVVISIIYRHAPEAVFPAAVEDSFEGLLYVMNHPKEFDINNSKVGMGGTSAGGNMTAVMNQKYVNSELSKGLPPLKIQVLDVPATDQTATTENYESYRENEFSPQLPAEKTYWYRQLYLPEGGSTLTDPEASPIFYPDESFKKVAPAFIVAAGCDILRGEAEAYHEKLLKNGVPTKLNIYDGVPHPIMMMGGSLKIGQQAVNDTCAEIKKALY